MFEQEKMKQEALTEKAKKIDDKFALDLESVKELSEEEKAKTNPRGAGRKPVKYKPEYCELLIESASIGETQAEFAAKIHVSKGLLNDWALKHKRFSAAMSIANEVSEAWFDKTVRFSAVGINKDANARLLTLYAKNKFGWKDHQDVVASVGIPDLPIIRVVERNDNFPTEELKPEEDKAV
jgi:hypothetical protein